MIATDNLSFTVVQNIGFQQLVSKLEPQHEIKSKKLYQIKLFPMTYKDVLKKIRVSFKG